MPKDIPVGAVKLSDTMYLFKSATNSSDCMISAHGGYVVENRSFTVPANTTIHFYGDHGAALLDPGISSFDRKLSRAVPVETYTAGQSCRNYLLTKYQGAHAGESGTETVETYAQVSNTVKTRDMVRQQGFDRLIKSTGLAQHKGLEGLMQEWGGSVLTIRNRWNVFLGIPLQTAIKEAQKHSASIRIFHCVFCRSNMLGEDKLAAQDVKFR